MTFAAGFCPGCGGFLMLLPESVGTHQWVWECHHCFTLFYTKAGEHFEDEQSDADGFRDDESEGSSG